MVKFPRTASEVDLGSQALSQRHPILVHPMLPRIFIASLVLQVIIRASENHPGHKGGMLWCTEYLEASEELSAMGGHAHVLSTLRIK